MVETEALAALGRARIGVHLVWTPILDSDDRAAALAAAARVHDGRVRQYWDEGHRLAEVLGERLRIPPREGSPARAGLAWDVYLVYPPRAAWGRHGTAPPTPACWMHQLNQVSPAQAPLLDGATLRRWLDALSRGQVEAACPAPSP